MTQIHKPIVKLTINTGILTDKKLLSSFVRSFFPKSKKNKMKIEKLVLVRRFNKS